MVQRKTVGERIYKVILYTLLVLLSIATVYPFLYCLILSFNDGYDTLRGGIYLFPRVFTLGNYTKAFEHPLILNSFKITVMRTLITTGVSVFLTAMLAYGLSIKGLPGRKYIVFFFFFTTLFSGGLIPTYILFRSMKILNTFWVLVLPSLFSFYNAVIMRTFFAGIPASLSESARIDGATEFSIFFRLILPLSLPVVATIALFVGVGAWNDWFAGAFYIKMNDQLVPASTLLYKIVAEARFESSMSSGGESMQQFNEALFGLQRGTTPESLQMTFVVIIITPILCVYPFLQRFFVKGVMVGSLKE